MNLFELELPSFYVVNDEEDDNLERTLNCLKFLNHQHQLKRLEISLACSAWWEIAMMMQNLGNLEFFKLCLYTVEEGAPLMAIPHYALNTSVKHLKLEFERHTTDLEMCQNIVNYFSGLIDLDLRWFV